MKKPMGKPWGLQTDSDLWEIMWEGLLMRGQQIVTWEKVKGHATAKHIEQGLATEETKHGNDWADHYATKGIEQHQHGATHLAKWLASRQKVRLNSWERFKPSLLHSFKKKRKKGDVMNRSKKPY